MEERQATGVAMGSGLSCTTDLAEAGTYVVQGLVRKCAFQTPSQALGAPAVHWAAVVRSKDKPCAQFFMDCSAFCPTPHPPTSVRKQMAMMLTACILNRISPFLVTRILANSPAGAISIRHGFHGPNLAPATACAAGALLLLRQEGVHSRCSSSQKGTPVQSLRNDTASLRGSYVARIPTCPLEATPIPSMPSIA